MATPRPRALARQALFGRLAGWFVLYVAAGGLLGFALARHQEPWRLFADGGGPPPGCWPDVSLFEFIASHCAYGAVNWFWFFTIGLPRLIVGAFGMTFALTCDAMRGAPDPSALPLLVVSATVSAMMIFIYAIAFRHARKRTMWLGLVLLLDIGLYARVALS